MIETGVDLKDICMNSRWTEGFVGLRIKQMTHKYEHSYLLDLKFGYLKNKFIIGIFERRDSEETCEA